MRRYLPWAAALLALAMAPKADAALEIYIGNLALLPGQTGFVDVMIRSTGADLLDSFGVEFQITTSSGTTRLEFVDPPPDPQLTDSNYVFFSNSLVASGFAPAGAISSNPTTNDTYIGGDGTISMAGVWVTTDTLLARLEVTANTLAPPAVGDTFTISLVPSSSPAAGSTFFSDPLWAEIDFSSTSGTVSMVPEPGTLAMFLVLGTLGTALCVARRRRS